MSEYIIDVEYDTFNGTFSQKRREEITRCRDCELSAYNGEECMRIDEWDDSLWFPVEPDGFCKWGEPK